ncbi:MAG: hypothetical protein ABSG52_16455 [Terriglobales bacterium]
MAKLLLGIIAYYVGALFLVRERYRLFELSPLFIPLILYILVGGIFMRSYLCEYLTTGRHPELDKQQTASLTLAGFCFTSLSFLVSFFKDEIRKPGNDAPAGIILFFCCALVSFIASYMTLRFRIRNLSEYAADGFIDNGFWCIIVGLLKLFSGTNGMGKVANVIVGLLVFYSGYLILSLVYQVQVSRVNSEKVSLSLD